MSLLSQPKPFENIILENGKALCLAHQEDLNSVYLNRKLFGSYDNIAACSKCTKPPMANAKLLAAFQAYSASQSCVVSPNLSKKPSELAPTFKNPSLDFGNLIMEHVLWDMNSNGYDLKGLVYMKDQKVLAACSKNGSVCFWSIGDSVELIEPKLNLEKKINFAKYCAISKDKKYLAISTDKGVHIYNMAEEGSCIRLLGVIDEDKVVSDLDFLEIEGKIVTVYDESIAKIWNLYTLEMEKVVDLQKYNIKGKVHTVMYMEISGKLAIEHEKGLSVIRDLQDEESADVKHHLVENKESFGCKYLQNSGRFIMNNGSYIEILEEEDFERVRRYPMEQSNLFRDNLPKKFISSQDESLFISNGQFSQFNSYKEGKLFRHSLNNFIWGMSDVELIEDQYRIAVAHPTKGTVTIMRVNASINIERGEGLPLLPAVSSTEERLATPFSSSGGGLFSGGGSGSAGSLFSGAGSGGSLFSGSGFGGSLFSGGGSGGGLFSRNSAPHLRNPPSRVNNANPFGSNLSKKSTKPKPKQTSKPAKKGKKIQKIQVRSVAAAKKKKEKSAPSSIKKEKKKIVTKVESSKKQKKTEQNKGMIEAVRISGKKKTKEERVWVVLPSAADDEKKRGRSLNKKNKDEKTKVNKTNRKADVSEDRSRSRSKSKSVTRKK